MRHVAIVMAAGIGIRLHGHDHGPPKALLTLDGERLVDRHIRLLNQRVDAIVWIVGHRAEDLIAAVSSTEGDHRFAHNPDFEGASVLSLRAGLTAAWEQFPEHGILLMDADMVYPRSMLDRLLAYAGNTLSVVVNEGDEEACKVMLEGEAVVDFGKHIDPGPGIAEWCGFLKLDPVGARRLLTLVEAYVPRGDASYEDPIRDLLVADRAQAQTHPPHLWAEIDFQEDLAAAETTLQAIRQADEN